MNKEVAESLVSSKAGLHGARDSNLPLLRTILDSLLEMNVHSSKESRPESPDTKCNAKTL